MSWFPSSIRAAAVLLVIGLTGCVTAVPGYRYTVETAGGDYYYDERPAVTTSIHVLPSYGAFGYSAPGGWYGSVGFGFGTYYGLGGYYGPSWGAFGPRYGYAGYWRPPYYYTPRYSRPNHYDRPPYRNARPLPWRDSGNAWRQPRHDERGRSHEQDHWNRPAPRRNSGNRSWRGRDNALVDGPRIVRPGERGHPSARPLPAPRNRAGAPLPSRQTARDMNIQPSPGAPAQRIRHAIVPPTREAISPAPRQMVRAANRGNTRIATVDGPPPQRMAAPPTPSRRTAATNAQPRAIPRPAATPPRRAMQPGPTAQPRPASQARPAPVQRPMPSSRPAPAMRSAPPPAPRSSGGPSRRSGGEQRHR